MGRLICGSIFTNVPFGCFLTSLLVIGLFVSGVTADLREDWNYGRLFKTADLVVIAKPAGEEKTKERFRPHGRRMTFGRVISSLSVQYTLKGKCDEKVKIYH